MLWLLLLLDVSIGESPSVLNMLAVLLLLLLDAAKLELLSLFALALTAAWRFALV